MAKQNNRKKQGLIITIGLVILTKLKSLVALLKLFKFGGTFISMIVSLAAYAVFFGWKFAIVLIYLLFIHESGHLIAARRKGIPTTPAVFVPFLGAVIGMKEQPKDAATEAYVAYGGPLAGLVSILPGVLLFYLTNDPIWALVIYLGAFINLFNLVPASPLDGGRIVGVLSTKLWFVGLLLIVVYFYFSQAPILLIVLIFGFINWWQRVRQNYTLRRIQLQLEARREHSEQLAKIEKDLFYEQSFYLDDEDPMIIGYMKTYIINSLRQQVEVVERELSKMRDWHFPFVHDKDKLHKEQLNLKKRQLIELIQAIQAANDYMDWKTYQERHHDQIKTLKKRKGSMKTYYKAEKSTKWKVFGAYVLLAILLSSALLYADNILSNARDQLMYM